MTSRPTRAHAPVEQTWNLADIYLRPEDWEADRAGVEAEIATVTAYQGRLGEGAGVLLACLRARDALLERLQRVDTSARLAVAGDGTDPLAQRQNARGLALNAMVQAALSFLTTELAALPDGTIDGYLADEPALATYRLQLERVLADRPHLLAPETEAALAALGDVLNSPAILWRQATAVDLVCPPIASEHGDETAVSIARYVFGLAQSPDRGVRRRAHESLAAGLGAHQATLAANLAAQIRRNVTLARLRRFPSTTAMLLHGQQVPEAAYRNVLTIIHDEGAMLTRRLVRLRQRVLGLDQVFRYDLEAPLDPDFNPTADFAASAEPILAALRPLGDDYTAAIAAAFRERWVDWADNVGKASGAFCASVYGVHPYILTTWQGRLRDRFILAHELGHAGHGVLRERHQVVTNTRPSLFFIEAPSTIHELLLGRYMLDLTDEPQLRRWVIMQFLGTFTHNMVTHLLEAHFEQRLYDLADAGTPLTLATILAVQGEVFARYYDDTVTLTDADLLYWAQQPHFYYGLYPYTYAAGLACAVAVAAAIQTEGQPAVDRWLAALAAGGTLPPVDLARLAGVDMTDPTTLRRAVAFFGGLVDELERSFPETRT